MPQDQQPSPDDVTSAPESGTRDQIPSAEAKSRRRDASTEDPTNTSSDKSKDELAPLAPEEA